MNDEGDANELKKTDKNIPVKIRQHRHEKIMAEDVRHSDQVKQPLDTWLQGVTRAAAILQFCCAENPRNPRMTLSGTYIRHWVWPG